jgi:hypothetical protein
MDILTERILTHDSVSCTEKALGKKHWSQFSDAENMVCLENTIRDNEIKNEHLKSIGDTYPRMTWTEFKELLLSKGFRDALTYEFECSDLNVSRIEEAIIYYNPEKGMIVWATSFCRKKDVNGGTLYAEIQANSPEDEKIIWRWLSTGGCRDRGKRIYETSHDVREGLFSKLDTLETAGQFLKEWTVKDRFLWFVDYVDTENPKYDYEAITQSRIEKCPEEFRKIIGR